MRAPQPASRRPRLRLSRRRSGSNGATVRLFVQSTLSVFLGHDWAIETPSGTGTTSEGDIWDGPGFGKAGQFGSPVIGADHASHQELLCVDGALTGTKCNMFVVATGGWINLGPGWEQVSTLTQTDGQTASMEGDSGGAVFRNAPGNAPYKIATGLINGGDNSRKCTDPVAPWGYAQTINCGPTVLATAFAVPARTEATSASDRQLAHMTWSTRLVASRCPSGWVSCVDRDRTALRRPSALTPLTVL